MRKIAITLFLIGVMIISCEDSSYFDITPRESIYGSRNIISVIKDYKDYSRLQIGNGFMIDLDFSEEYSMELRVDDNIVEYVVISQSGDKVFIGLDDDRSYKNITIEVYISMPDLNSISLSGGSESLISGFGFSHSLDLELSGGSKIIGDIETGNLYADLSGGSQINLIGRGNNLELFASGASRAVLKDYDIYNANVHLSGASNSTIKCYGVLSADLSGASFLCYYGNPEFGGN